MNGIECKGEYRIFYSYMDEGWEHEDCLAEYNIKNVEMNCKQIIAQGDKVLEIRKYNRYGEMVTMKTLERKYVK